MQIHTALTAAAAQAGWNATRVAVEAGVTEAAARRWMNGRAIPGGDVLLRLMDRLPGFREALQPAEIAS
jgi:transcriptional regulator with XRE-family HTH domain